MQLLKISCTRCPHYRKCPRKTRMYVNYCGSDYKRVKQQIHAATIDCRTRRGQLFAQNLLSVIPVESCFDQVITPVSS